MSNVSDPIWRAVAVTPSDTADLPGVTSAIYIGTAGNMQVTMGDGVVVAFTNLPVGWHPIQARRIWSTNTAASGIVAGFPKSESVG
jgi:hypothetical protein